VAGAVAYLLHGPWPEAFKSSVQVDLKVIGDLGAANLRTPAVRNRAILRATRAKGALSFHLIACRWVRCPPAPTSTSSRRCLRPRRACAPLERHPGLRGEKTAERLAGGP
jgi:hypothetical protein